MFLTIWIARKKLATIMYALFAAILQKKKHRRLARFAARKERCLKRLIKHFTRGTDYGNEKRSLQMWSLRQYCGGPAWWSRPTSVLRLTRETDEGEHNGCCAGKACSCRGKSSGWSEGEDRQCRPSHGGEALHRVDRDSCRRESLSTIPCTGSSAGGEFPRRDGEYHGTGILQSPRPLETLERHIEQEYHDGPSIPCRICGKA